MIPRHRAPIHPGEILLHEFLIPKDLSQMALAQKLRIPVQRINTLIHGKRGVTAETALLLSGEFGTSPEFWMNLQNAWDLYHAQRRLKAA
ncbi:MAG TPA: HigA family addiction module antitoxin [Fibrobacteria bacterium]|nr:HigA family addiction module antitoxin [Fibrobacteria bacterium]